MDIVRLIFIYVALALSFTLYAPESFSQSSESQAGYTCQAGAFQVGILGEGSGLTIAQAQNQACSNSGGTFTDGQCLLPPNINGVQVILGLSCSQTAVCLTGNGFERADSGGFCPDPPSDDEDSGDDDDGDGSDCDVGEEHGEDCNDGDEDDTDSDGDGVPDSEDDDDGVCSSHNEGDLDCDGSCGVQDDPNSEDCSGTAACEAGAANFFNIDFMEQFGPGSVPSAIPPDEICFESCQYDRNDNGSGTDSCTRRFVGDEEQGVQCRYTQTGETCDLCTAPQCTDTDNPCPSGQTRTGSDNQCTDIPNFCNIDEHTNGTEDGTPDGRPDNEDTFACGGDADCDTEENADCSNEDAVGQYSCGLEEPPVCADGEDRVVCAIREQTYQDACGVNATDVFDCDEDFLCDGDTFKCALLSLEKANYCSIQLTEEEEADEDSLANFREGVDDGINWEGGPEVEGSVVNVQALVDDLDDSGYGFPRQCDLDSSVRAFGQTFELPFSNACSSLIVLRYIIMLAAALTAFFIVRGSF